MYRDDLALAFAKQGVPLKPEELVELLGPCAHARTGHSSAESTVSTAAALLERTPPALVTVVPRVL